MMNNFIIDGIDFENLEAERYWTFAKSYKGDKKKETKAMFLSGEYLASLKNDGHYFRFIKNMNGDMRLQSRTPSVNGGYLNKYDWVPQCHSFFESLPNGTCLIGELFFPKNRGSRKVTTIMGCLVEKALQRQEKDEKLFYYIFDCYAYDGKNLINTPYIDRIKYINNEIKELADKNDYVSTAQFYEGQEAWDRYAEYLAAGLEGVVLYKKTGKVDPGKRPARKTLKCKLEIEQTIDAFLDGDYKPPTKEYTGKCIEDWGYWLNERTGEKLEGNYIGAYTNGKPIIPITKPYFLGYAGSLSFSVMKDGKPEHIGWISGVPDEMKRGIVQEPEKWKGRVFELTCMELEHIQDSYSMRHTRIVQERVDKTAAECDWSQIENSK
jgi:hypothetical protein